MLFIKIKPYFPKYLALFNCDFYPFKNLLALVFFYKDHFRENISTFCSLFLISNIEIDKNTNFNNRNVISFNVIF